MSLYPTILFHFTKKIESLIGILKNDFYVSFSKEKISSNGLNGGPPLVKEFYVPMVSFCDLRLSELKDHMNSYGSYGIGLSKEWARRQQLNPVMYVERNSHFTYNYLKGIDDLYYHFRGEINFELVFNPVMNSFRYMKNYQDDLIRECYEPVPNYVFANEREWRFVPLFTGHLDYLNIEDITCKCEKIKFSKLKQAELESNRTRLTFSPRDIKYIIVDNETEILQILATIPIAKARFSRKSIELLKSRILTREQILNDV
jgi:hypothetical protein